MLHLLLFVASRLLGLAALGCVDDVNSCEPLQSAPSGLISWKRFAQDVCGFRMEPSKQGIGKQLIIQGALCGISQPELQISIAPSRKISFSTEIDSALQRFPPSSARKLATKLSFACRHLFGKFGRALVKPLHRRGHCKVYRQLWSIRSNGGKLC